MAPIFFKNPSEFRKWLEAYHQKERELWVGFYKKGSGKQNMTWSESVDEALCFGWIDSVRKSLDKDSYCIRFTPRKPTSIWSSVNIAKIEELTKSGRMQAAGMQAYQHRKVEKSEVYSFENEANPLPADLEEKFKANKAAWDFFTQQAPSYQKTITHWIMAAKREETKRSRLEKAIAESEKRNRLT